MDMMEIAPAISKVVMAETPSGAASLRHFPAGAHDSDQVLTFPRHLPDRFVMLK